MDLPYFFSARELNAPDRVTFARYVASVMEDAHLPTADKSTNSVFAIPQPEVVVAGNSVGDSIFSTEFLCQGNLKSTRYLWWVAHVGIEEEVTSLLLPSQKQTWKLARQDQHEQTCTLN